MPLGDMAQMCTHELTSPLQCWEVRPSAAGYSCTIKGSDAATTIRTTNM
jgi:hypothetical protein